MESTKRLKCSECSLVFDKPARLKRHMLRHTGERPYACSREVAPGVMCIKAFTRKDHLDRHIKADHENRRDLVCPFCARGFYEQSHLKRHIVTHEKERNAAGAAANWGAIPAGDFARSAVGGASDDARGEAVPAPRAKAAKRPRKALAASEPAAGASDFGGGGRKPAMKQRRITLVNDDMSGLPGNRATAAALESAAYADFPGAYSGPPVAIPGFFGSFGYGMMVPTGGMPVDALEPFDGYGGEGLEEDPEDDDDDDDEGPWPGVGRTHDRLDEGALLAASLANPAAAALLQPALEATRWTCPFTECGLEEQAEPPRFSKRSELRAHWKEVHGTDAPFCASCGRLIQTANAMKHHGCAKGQCAGPGTEGARPRGLSISSFGGAVSEGGLTVALRGERAGAGAYVYRPPLLPPAALAAPLHAASAAAYRGSGTVQFGLPSTWAAVGASASFYAAGPAAGGEGSIELALNGFGAGAGGFHAGGAAFSAPLGFPAAFGGGYGGGQTYVPAMGAASYLASVGGGVLLPAPRSRSGSVHSIGLGAGTGIGMSLIS